MLSSRVKQRLVGSLVLVILAAVVVPLIFDLEPSTPVDQTSVIPPAPKIEPVIIEEPVEPLLDNEVIPVEQVFDLAAPIESGEVTEEPVVAKTDIFDAAPNQAATEASVIGESGEVKEASVESAVDEKRTQSTISLPDVEPKLSSSGLPEAWVIQVVSYQEKAKASALNQKLQGAGFKSFVRTAVVSGRAVHRVFVGPQILRQQAEDEKARIDRSLGVNSMVIPFEP